MSYGYKLGDNKIILVNSVNEEIKPLYLIGSCGEHLFRSLFNQKASAISPSNQLSFLSKHFRLKCDNCAELCEFQFYLEKSSSTLKDDLGLRDSITVCLKCYKSNNFPQSIEKSCLILTNIYSVLSGDNLYKPIKSNEIWNTDEIRSLVILINKFGDNWDEIEKGLAFKKTKNQIINKFLQLPIKEKSNFKILTPSTFDVKTNAFSSNTNKEGHPVTEKNSLEKTNDCAQDLSNPFLSQISFFMKMFSKFLKAECETEKSKQSETAIQSIKDSIYKNNTSLQMLPLSDHAKPIEANPRMKCILDLLLYTQMKKIELKLDYFSEFERLIEQEASQIKTIETHIVQDKVKFAMRRIELNNQLEKLKAVSKPSENNFSSPQNENSSGKKNKEDKVLISIQPN